MESKELTQALHQPGAQRRGDEILHIFNDAFGDLIKSDPSAIENKFRKMSGSSFAFYRGAACLFYHDMARDKKDAEFLNKQTSRVWIHGDLHAENFGTYMDNQGRLIFNVNDFDEAYVGPFTWDLKRFVASIALVAYSKALSDDQISKLVRTYAAAYREQINALATTSDSEKVSRFTLDTSKGPLLDVLHSAREQKHFELLDSMTEIRNHERRFTRGGSADELDDEMKEAVTKAFERYLETLPNANKNYGSHRIKDIVGRRGIGIGSAGLPSYNVLLGGKTQALEDDIVIYMKQSQPSAMSQHVENTQARDYFHHEGHRTVVSQRALQAHADAWLGWTEIDGAGMMVAEVSPYEVDFDWSETNDFKAMADVVADLGRATAIMHAVGDDDDKHSELVPFSPEKAINEAIGSDEDGGFEKLLVDFAHEYGSQTRRDHEILVHLFRNGRIPGLGKHD